MPKRIIKIRRLFKLSKLWVVLTTLVAGGFCTYGAIAWRSTSSFENVCEQAVLQQQRSIQRKSELAALEEKRQAEERRQRKIAKADSRRDKARRKWAEVIADVQVFDSKLDVMPRSPSAAENRDSFQVSSISLKESISSRKPEKKAKPEFWSFRSLKPAVPSEMNKNGWARNPIDHFILAKLDSAGLSPNTEASRSVLARRLWFDMVGLPPEIESLETFVADARELSYGQFVEKLLADPRFGEHWAQFWLDAARYADSNGFEEDEIRRHAYPYRDFVIWAMNSDLPFDQFVRWQIAGDELEPENPLAVAATGFLTAAPYNTFLPQESERWDELDDMVSTLCSSMLGLSVGCARCHDHRFDPIPTEEYYGLIAVFAGTKRTQSYLAFDAGREYRIVADPIAERKKEIDEILTARVKEDNISELDYFTAEEKNLLRMPVDSDNKEQARLISLCERCLMITADHIDDDDLEPLPQDEKRYDRLQAEIAELKLNIAEKPIMGLTITGSTIENIHVLEGGDLKRKQQEVGPRFVSSVTQGRMNWKAWDSKTSPAEPSRPRTALANWTTDVEFGAGSLLARVIVNRLWQHHFGQGLVRTPNDFGEQGDRPSHPELLDWLAGELISNGWRLKPIYRLILNSATYRQSTKTDHRKHEIDPENRLLGTRRPKRLTAEMLWDAMQSAGGDLNQKMYGPSVKFPIPREAIFHTQDDLEKTWPSQVEDDRPALWQRGIYLTTKRTIPNPFLQLFDAPCGAYSCGQRKTTTVPTQALAIWHSHVVRRQSRKTAARVLSEVKISQDDPEYLHELIRQTFLITVSRQPQPKELENSLAFFSESSDSKKAEPLVDKLSDFCHVMFMTNEFLYID